MNLEAISLPAGGQASTRAGWSSRTPRRLLQLLPVPRAMAATGAHVLCAGSRYQRNDTALIMEKVFLDLSAYIRHAKQVWGYRHVVLVGWSGGGALAVATVPRPKTRACTHTPAGDAVDLKGRGLDPGRRGDLAGAAHLARAPAGRDHRTPR